MKRLEGIRVMVVDDDPHVRALLVFVLRECGAVVESTGSPEEAVQLVELAKPQAVVTDLKMPQHDGVWLLHEVQKRAPGLPVIAVSGYVADYDVRKLLGLGFADVLAKPLPLDDVPHALARVLGLPS